MAHLAGETLLLQVALSSEVDSAYWRETCQNSDLGEILVLVGYSWDQVHMGCTPAPLRLHRDRLGLQHSLPHLGAPLVSVVGL
jgi:hypothetical protein